MKRFWAVLIVLVMVLLPVVGVSTALADDTASEGSGIVSLIWKFVNSPVGLSVVAFILAFILGKIFTAKPTWKLYADKYKPLLMEAIKKAEKAIPDNAAGVGLLRLDMALKYVLSINAKLDEVALKEAISAVHTKAEAGGNI